MKRTRAEIAADKKRTGRPPSGPETRQIPVLIRISASEKTAWTKASQAEGMGLGPWIAKPRRDAMGKGE